MALRISGARQEAPVEEPVEQEIPVEEAPVPEDLMAELPPSLEEEPMAAGGEVDQFTAGYLGPEHGPFTCSNCTYFSRQGPNTCAIVGGHIEPEGCCNLFTSLSVADDEAPMPEEVGAEPVPAEEPLPEEPEAAMASEEGY